MIINWEIFIEDSGIDLCWIEADLYGPTTGKQIIDGNHVKRGQAAHMVTLQALFSMYHNAFFHQEPELLECLQKVAEDLATACVKSTKSEAQKVHAEMVETIQSSDVITRMKALDDSHDKISEFQVFRSTWEWSWTLCYLYQQLEQETGFYIWPRLNRSRSISWRMIA